MKGICTIVAACLLVSGVVYALEFSDNFDDGNYYGWLEPLVVQEHFDWDVESGDTASIWFDDVSLTYVSFYGVQERNAGVPSVDLIFQSKPNPFTRQVKIEYCVLTISRVQLKIYNVLGEIVRTLVDETKCAGKYEIIWDSRDTQGKELPSGNYFYQLVTNEVASTKKLILLK